MNHQTTRSEERIKKPRHNGGAWLERRGSGWRPFLSTTAGHPGLGLSFTGSSGKYRNDTGVKSHFCQYSLIFRASANISCARWRRVV